MYRWLALRQKNAAAFGFCSKHIDIRLVSGYIQPVKIAKTLRSRKANVDISSSNFTLSNAKTYLGRLMEKAEKGEPVYIVRGHRRFLLQPVAEIEPIPVRAPGYFAKCYTPEEVVRDNRLAKASVVRAPKDLE